MTDSPAKANGRTPMLLESPGSKADDFHGEGLDDDSFPEAEGYATKVGWIIRGALLPLAKIIVKVSNLLASLLHQVWANVKGSRRNQAGGVIFAYLVLLYVCTLTMPLHLPICPASTESQTVTERWRLAQGRPQDSCATNEMLDQLLEEREGILVKISRPITFLSHRKRGRRHAPSVAERLTNTTAAKAVKSINATETVQKEPRRVSRRYGRRRFNPIMAIWRHILRRLAHPRRMSDAALLKAIQDHPYPQAFSQEPLLSSEDMDFLEAWSERLVNDDGGIKKLHRRVVKVGWGGRSKWWHPVYPRSSFYPLETIDGANLLFPYYEAMQPYLKDEEHVRFPRRRCAAGCDTQVALRATLEWRETYTPWMATGKVLEENEAGWVYTRGLSNASPYGRHAVVWIRPGHHSVRETTAYTRAIVQTVDRAIGESLRHGRAGRINIVLDAEGYEWKKIPDFRDIRLLLEIFQEHYPGRLGAVFLCNMSPAAEILFSLLKPLLNKEILGKIYFLSGDPSLMTKQLKTVIPVEQIPVWLGGEDTYEFSTRNYYPSRLNMDKSHDEDYLPSLE
jgi:hypothetical protein